MPERIVVVGLSGPRYLPESLGQCGLVVGSGRHFAILASCSPAGAVASARRIELGSKGISLDRALDAIGSEGGMVAVLASGDPGFFGVVRPLAERFGAENLEVHPAPSSVSLAFAALGLWWDDALVVSAHGRPLADAAELGAGSAKVAILCSPSSPPEAVAQALLEAGDAADGLAAVCSQVGTPAERVLTGTLAQLSRGPFDPVSVLVRYEMCGTETDNRGTASLAWDGAELLQGSSTLGRPEASFGRPEADFEHRDGMITKAEVRAVVLSRLALPSRGVMWDVGAGSGSVAIEAALLQKGLRVIAIESDPASAARITTNAERFGTDVEVVVGTAPGVLDALSRPDRIFIGGGGITVLDAALDRLAPTGRAAATFTTWERAQAGADRLGSACRITTSRAHRHGEVWQLEDLNPVFVAWGPSEHDSTSMPGIGNEV